MEDDANDISTHSRSDEPPSVLTDHRWFPIASIDDLPLRHVYAGDLAGHELAVWRADDHHVNVWEDRCVHRGVRLSIGINDGAELMCQYHGWRYANRTGSCTYIPAHPADAPAQTICTRSFPAVERYGLIWSSLDGIGEPPVADVLEDVPATVLRALPFAAAPEHVLARLADHSFAPAEDLERHEAPTMSADTIDGPGIVLTSTTAGGATTVVFFVQPADADRTWVRPVLVGDDAAGIDVLVHHVNALDDLRTAIELEAARRERPAQPEPAFLPVAEPTERPTDARRAPVRVRVAAKYETAAGIMAFDLEPLTPPLPAFQPGAHIDVHLPNGLVRQYSLTNGPTQTDVYRIGVKLEAESSGGSSCLHDDVREGDVFAVSAPHNNFTLRRDADKTLLIAGGIGITPLLSMAKTISRAGLDWELHYYAQSAAHVAFGDELGPLGDPVTLHLGLTPEQTLLSLERILAAPRPFSHAYVCGPRPMLDAARRLAAEHGWPDAAIHFEYFSNDAEFDDSSTFEISLARSALTLTVNAGETILQVLRANGVPCPSSCEQGACGTCLVGVLAGTPDHHDVYMNDTDHAANDRIATCISRSLSERLILDI